LGLFNSTVLDLAIGIVFVYLLLAIICTTINEWIASAFGLRSKTLGKAIKQLLDNQKQLGSDSVVSFLEDFYKHPLVTGMVPRGTTPSDVRPSYLSARTFASAVMDLATKNTPGTITFQNLEDGAKKLQAQAANDVGGDVGKALLALLQNAKGDIDVAQKNIENWFDDAMQRASGWYKRETQWITFFVAVILTIGTNADTVHIAQTLWINPTLRATLVEKAKGRTETGKEASGRGVTADYPDKNDPLHPQPKPTKDELAAIRPLLGWQGVSFSDAKTPGATTSEVRASDEEGWPSRLLGWALSIVAISLGAPFWFDTLKKLMNLRSAGQKPEKSEDQKNGGGGTNGGKVTTAPAGGGH